MSGDNISVSFKTGTGYDAALLNFKGSNSDEVKAAVMEFFSLGSEVVEWTAFEVFAEADRLAKAVYSVKSGLGGKTVNDEPAVKPAVTVNVKAKPSPVQPIDFTALPAQAAQTVEPSKPDAAPTLIEQIASAASKAVLAELYSANKTAWQGDVVKAAIKRSAELA